MRTRRAYNGFRTAAVVVCAIGFMLSSGAVRAQDPNDPNAPAPPAAQNKGQQKCIVEANKNVAKVIKAVNKDVTNCIKNGGKGKTEKMGNQNSIDVCTTLDVKSKVAKAKGKLKTKVGDKCSAAEDGTPDFGTNTGGLPDPNGLNDIGDSALELAEALFGSSLDAAIVILNKVTDKQDVNPTNTKLEGKCQTSIIKNAGKCLDTKWKIYNKCKKNALKGKVGSPITDASGLEACVASTPADAKVVKTCVTKLGEKMTKKCGAEVDLDAVIPNAGAANAGEVATFIDARVECLFCQMVAQADGLGLDCDLFDDGLANDSCLFIDAICAVDEGSLLCEGGSDDGEPCEDNFLHLDCGDEPNNPGLCRPTASQARLNNQVLEGAFGPLIFQITPAEVSIKCGVPDGNGVASCRCALETAQKIALPIIFGDACLTPIAGSCAAGSIDCDGGAELDSELIYQHDAGNALKALVDPNNPGFLTECGNTDFLSDPNDGPEECNAICDQYCPLLGAGFSVLEARCEGYCFGGDLDEDQCEGNSECTIGGLNGNIETGAACNGAAQGHGVLHPNKCQCSCIRNTDLGGGSPPGTLSCQVGLRTRLEIGGEEEDCDQVGVQDIIGDQCVPFSTSIAASLTLNVGLDPNFADLDVEISGSEVTCAALRAGNLTGLVFAGTQASADGTAGDLTTTIQQFCQ